MCIIISNSEKAMGKDENFCFFRRNFGQISCSGGDETKEEGKMSAAEISINFTKNRRNFREISVKREISAIV